MSRLAVNTWILFTRSFAVIILLYFLCDDGAFAYMSHHRRHCIRFPTPFSERFNIFHIAENEEKSPLRIEDWRVSGVTLKCQNKLAFIHNFYVLRPITYNFQAIYHCIFINLWNAPFRSSIPTAMTGKTVGIKHIQLDDKHHNSPRL